MITDLIRWMTSVPGKIPPLFYLVLSLSISACDGETSNSAIILAQTFNDEESTKEGLIARPDTATVEPGSSVTIDVKNNDEGDINQATIETNVSLQSTRGWIRIDQNAGTIRYTPYAGQSGDDTFGYRLRVPGFGLSDPTIVSVTISSDGSSDGPAIPPSIPPSPNQPGPSQPEPGQPGPSQPGPDQPGPGGPDENPTSNGLVAAHRNGQTFLTWSETGTQDSYHVYRHSARITTSNLSSAKRLTSRWGPIDNDSSVNKYRSASAPNNFVIEDLGSPLSNDTGLFVYTTQQGDSSTAYYAVTSVKNGQELVSTLKTLNTAVNESVRQPRDVLTRSVNGGQGRTYTQYMDYMQWNPTLNGYAYNYSVALPPSYNRNLPYSLQIQLHAYGESAKSPSVSEYGWQVIQLFPHDPGRRLGTTHTWWYGYAADHDFNSGLKPVGGKIENFTEQRLMRSIEALILNPDFNIDEQRIYAFGNSMGGSGSLSLGIRYGSVISGIFASQPMTNYAGSTVFREELETLWGNRSLNLRITNKGLNSQPIQRYNNLGVWDWMDHHQQLQNRRGDTFAYLMTTHGKRDTVIEWQSQGAPTVRSFTDANVGFSATYRDVTHTWTGFNSVVRPLFGFDSRNSLRWRYPLNLSYPAIQRASDSSNISPANSGVDSYNLNIEWATAHTPFDTGIVDVANRYEITIKSNSVNQTANITPRRTSRFRANALQSCSWNATDRNNNQRIASGTVIADLDSLVTVRGFPIRTGTGTRLVINCP